MVERPYGCTCITVSSPSLIPPMLQQPNNINAMRRSSKSYEVTIEGIGPRPYVDCFEATSPGLAKLAAQDKFGRWIKVTEVKELPAKKLKLVKTTPKPRRIKQRNSRPINVVSPWK